MLSRIPWARSALGWLAQSLQAMQWVRVVVDAGTSRELRAKIANSLVRAVLSSARPGEVQARAVGLEQRVHGDLEALVVPVRGLSGWIEVLSG